MKCIKFPEGQSIESLCIAQVFYEIYLDNLYQVVVDNKYKTIVDLGAHIGIVSSFLAEHCEQLYSVEPNKQSYDCLVENIKANELTNVKMLNVAISNKVGEENFRKNDRNTTECKLDKDGAYRVRTVTLEKFVEDNKIEHIDFLKMDIEGGEVDVILDDSFNRVAHKIDNMMVALHALYEVRILDKLIGLGFNGQRMHEALGETVFFFSRNSIGVKYERE